MGVGSSCSAGSEKVGTDCSRVDETDTRTHSGQKGALKNHGGALDGAS